MSLPGEAAAVDAAVPSPPSAPALTLTEEGRSLVSSRRVARACAALAAIWVLLLVFSYAPGLMSADTMDQTVQGLSDRYSNLHPPALSWLLGAAMKHFGTPLPLLAAQLAGLAFALAAIARSAPPRRAVAALVAFAAALACPPLWAIGVALWKDVLMALVLLGTVVALRYQRPWLALGLLLIAPPFRHNGILAAVPLAIPVLVSCARRLSRRSHRVALVAVATLALFTGPKLVDRMVSASETWPLGQLFLFDSAGIYMAEPESFSDSLYRNEVSFETLQRAYTPSSVVPLLYVGPVPPVNLDTLAPRRSEVSREWLKLVRAYPRAYLMHRFRVFRSAIGATPGPVFFPYQGQIDPNPWGLTLSSPGSVRTFLMKVAGAAAHHTPLFRGWAWLLALAILGVVSALRRDALAAWTAASGLTYAFGYLLIGLGSDFRFLYWCVVSTLAVVTLRAAGAPGLRAPPSPGA